MDYADLIANTIADSVPEWMGYREEHLRALLAEAARRGYELGYGVNS